MLQPVPQAQRQQQHLVGIIWVKRRRHCTGLRYCEAPTITPSFLWLSYGARSELPTVSRRQSSASANDPPFLPKCDRKLRIRTAGNTSSCIHDLLHLAGETEGLPKLVFDRNVQFDANGFLMDNGVEVRTSRHEKIQNGIDCRLGTRSFVTRASDFASVFGTDLPIMRSHFFNSWVPDHVATNPLGSSANARIAFRCGYLSNSSHKERPASPIGDGQNAKYHSSVSELTPVLWRN